MKLRARLGWTVLLTGAALVAGWLAFAKRQRDGRMDDALREFAWAALAAGGHERAEREPGRFLIFVPGTVPPLPRMLGARRPTRPGEGEPGAQPGIPAGPTPTPGGPTWPPRREPGTLGGPEGRPDPRDPAAPRDPIGPRDPMGPRDGPGSRPGVGSPPREDDGTWLWAYDATLASRNRDAPPMPEALRDDLRDGASSAATDWRLGDRVGRQVALRTAWPDGACAYVLVRRMQGPEATDAATLLWGSVALAGGLLLAVLWAAGPVVRRLRRLEQRVAAAQTDANAPAAPLEGNDEVASVARAFDRAGAAVRAHLATVEARGRTLRDFVGNTTHDVAIPLTVLQGHLAALRDQAAAGRPADGDRIRHSLEETHYVGMLLHNLGAVARLESGEVHLDRHRVDLRDVVRRALDRHAPIARGRGVALEHALPDEAVEVLGDVTLLEQAVSNVVHNAVSYADAGGHVGVVLALPREPAGAFTLRVADDGPGIPPEELVHVTERAFRGQTGRARRPGGGGLGLAIAKDVVDRHGFALALARVEPRGLEVTISGRRADDAAHARVAPAP